jgi:hypothetical protein
MSGATPSPREIRESDQLVAITGGRKNAASPPNNLPSELSSFVEREEVVDEDDRVTFSEVCEYPDGSRIVVETMLEVRSGKLFRQTDVVAKDTWAISKGETDPAEAKGEGK